MTARDGVKGEVNSVNVLRQTVKVIVTLENEEKEIQEYKVDELRFKPRRKKEKNNKNKHGNQNIQPNTQAEEKELKELEALERKEGKSKLNDK